MPDLPAPAFLPADLRATYPLDELLHGLLAVSLTGIALYTPIRGEDNTLVDFTIDLLNPAAQRMLGQPARPSGTYLQHYPHTLETGVFAFHRDAFESGAPAQLDVNYQGDGLDNYFRLSAQRVGQGLLVSFTDTAHEPRTAVEVALRESQAREQAARAEAERERGQVQALLQQAPVAIGLFEGLELRITAANPLLSAMWGRPQADVLGRPLLEAVPELQGQGFEELLQQVLTTRVPYVGAETPAQLLREEHLQTTYYNFVYQPLYDAQGAVLGVLVVAIEVTEQVRARQQVEAQERQTALLNEELQAANEEILTNNRELERTQQQLRQLNEELEARVAERTHALHRAQVAAEQEREQLYQVFEQTPVAIAIMRGPNLRVELANPTVCALWGRTPAQVVGRPYFEVVPDTAGQGFEQVIAQVLTTGEPFALTEAPVTLARAHTGLPTQAFVNFVFQPLRDADGNSVGLIASGTEVTEQVRARQQVQQLNQELAASNEALEARVRARTQEAQLARQEAERQRGEFQRVFEQAPVAIAVFRGPTYIIELANPTVCALWGRTPAQTIGTALFTLLPEITGQGFEELLDQVRTTSQPYEAREMPSTIQRHGRLDTVYWDFVYLPVYEPDGTPRGVMVVATEVTAQVEARRQVEQVNQELEARVQQRTRQLEEQQRLLNQILREVPAAVATLQSPEHRFSFFNEQYQDLTGGRAQLGSPAAEIFPEVVAQGFIDLLDSVYTTGTPYFGRETPLQFRDPQTGQTDQHYLDFSYQPLLDGQGRIQGILVFAVEATAQVQARARVQELNEELAAINEELQVSNEELSDTNHQLTRTNTDLDTFVYMASHDLKVPITNIEGLVDALYRELRDLPGNDTVPRILGMMQEAVVRFQQTIGHLTDISRLQQEGRLVVEEVSLAAVLADVQLDLAPLLETSGAQLNVELAGTPELPLSPKNVRSVVYNLLSNALKFRHPERKPVIRVQGWQGNKLVVLEIADNGLGLEEHQQQRLFGLFQRLHPHIEGSGVGLYMVRKIVENAGGTVQVRSQVGVGTTFQVMLPRKRTDLG